MPSAFVNLTAPCIQPEYTFIGEFAKLPLDCHREQRLIAVCNRQPLTSTRLDSTVGTSFAVVNNRACSVSRGASGVALCSATGVGDYHVAQEGGSYDEAYIEVDPACFASRGRVVGGIAGHCSGGAPRAMLFRR